MNNVILIQILLISIIYIKSQDYTIAEVYKNDKQGNILVEKLLNNEGIRKDKNIDYTCAVYDENYNMIATASCFGNTLRCLAIKREHQGEGLVNKIFSHLLQYQFERNNFHVLFYTKYTTSKYFSNLGFYEIAKVKDQIVFMENKKNGFQDYLTDLTKTKKEGKKIASIVLNANPFTLGHQYLIEKASKENDILHIFILSEDKSIFPFNIRKQLLIEGTSHLKNIIYHDSGPYIISGATFPGYFQKDKNAVIESHVNLDLEIFIKIAKALNINVRYFGEESSNIETGIYNNIMKEKLPNYGINCIILSRTKDDEGEIINTSNLRKMIKFGRFEKIKKFVPDSTYKFLVSLQAKELIQKIKEIDEIKL